MEPDYQLEAITILENPEDAIYVGRALFGIYQETDEYEKTKKVQTLYSWAMQEKSEIRSILIQSAINSGELTP